MNASQIHLALNHVPLFFSLIGGIILLFGFFKKNDSIKILSLYLIIVAALFTIPVYLTGEGAEELVEKLPGVSGGLIEEHEEIAKIGLIIIIISGITALGTLIVKKKESLLKTGFMLCAVLSFVSFGFMAQTSHTGGQIRHTEIRNGATSLNNQGDETSEKEEDEKEKD